jgi:hypothetical protein
MVGEKKVGTIYVEFVGDTANYEKAVNQIQNVNTGLDTSVINLNQSLQLLNTGLDLAGQGYDMTAGKAVAFSDQMNNISYITGTSTDNIQRLKAGCDATGASFDAVSTSLIMFSQRIGDTGKAGDTLRAKLTDIGVAVKDTNGNYRDGYNILMDTFKQLNEMPNAFERDRLANELFGRSWYNLAPLVQEYNKAAKAAAAITPISQDEINKAKEYGEKIDVLNAKLGKMEETVGMRVIPIFDQWADKVNYLLYTLDQVWNGHTIIDYDAWLNSQERSAKSGGADLGGAPISGSSVGGTTTKSSPTSIYDLLGNTTATSSSGGGSGGSTSGGSSSSSSGGSSGGSGTMTKSELDDLIYQYGDYITYTVPKMAKAQNDLKKEYDDGTLTLQKYTDQKKVLDHTEQEEQIKYGKLIAKLTEFGSAAGLTTQQLLALASAAFTASTGRKIGGAGAESKYYSDASTWDPNSGISYSDWASGGRGWNQNSNGTTNYDAVNPNDQAANWTGAAAWKGQSNSSYIAPPSANAVTVTAETLAIDRIKLDALTYISSNQYMTDYSDATMNGYLASLIKAGMTEDQALNWLRTVENYSVAGGQATALQKGIQTYLNPTVVNPYGTATVNSSGAITSGYSNYNSNTLVGATTSSGTTFTINLVMNGRTVAQAIVEDLGALGVKT